jgi:hypothetical protein
MKKPVVFIFVLCLISSIDLSAQKLSRSDRVLIQNLKQMETRVNLQKVKKDPLPQEVRRIN